MEIPKEKYKPAKKKQQIIDELYDYCSYKYI